MIQAPEKLPKFKKPPVVEVLLGVQFGQLSGMHVGHLGLIWERFKAKFPRVEQQVRLPHVIERRGVHAPAMIPSISFMSASDQVPRIWLLSADNTDLVQVQSDRFMRNWRRYHDSDIAYPSYDGHNRPGFAEDFENFCRFTEDQQLGHLAVDQCEMVYINHIQPCGVWTEFAQLDRVFKGWSSGYPTLAGVAAGLIGCRVRHEVLDDEGRFVGHFFLEFDSAYSLRATEPTSGEPAPVLQFQLTVRGRPLGEGSEGVMQFMDLAHRVIVKSFAEVTTPEMHKVWERIQ